METTMAATPKARLATASASPSRPKLDESGLLAFPVPPPPPTARMLPAFAFPPANDPQGPTRAQEVRPTRRTTVRVPRQGSGPLSNALAELATFVENAPLPALPEQAWAFIGRAWFFVAGTTMGVLLALALVAIMGPKHAPPREARTATAEGTARVLVIQRASTAAERGMGALAENDIEDIAPPPPPVRRTAVVVRRPAAGHRSASGGKDILNAGL